MPDSPPSLLEKPFRFYLKMHWRTVVIGLGFLFITDCFETSIPLLVGHTIDALAGRAPFQTVAHLVGFIFAITVALSVTRYLWRVIWGQFHHRTAEDLRNRLFAKYTDLSSSFFRTHNVGQLVSLIAHDVNSFRMGIGPGLLVLFDGTMMAALILPRMYSISPSWTLKTLILMPFVPFTVRLLVNRVHRAYHQRQDRFAEMSGVAQEIVSGIRVIKSFAQEKQQTHRFNRMSRLFQGTCDSVARWDTFFPPALEMPVAVGSVVLLCLGAPEVMSGAISIGSLFAFYQYVQRMIWPMEAIGASVGQIQEGRSSFARIRRVLEAQSDVPDTGTVELEKFETLEVRSLSFAYPGRSAKALDDVSFFLRRGETLGVVGEAGSGKTTLIELLARQFQAPTGTILINGHSIETIRLSSLRRILAVVPQEAFLFSRRVVENLAFSRDEWQLDHVVDAAHSVHLHDEIENWPDGYDAMVGERGVNMSGGQKQRMTLARALMKDAELVVLDDSLSAVDAKTERKIFARLEETTTAVVVSHRLSSLSFADRILVLKNGHVEAIGTHMQLIAASPCYAQLYAIQQEAPAS